MDANDNTKNCTKIVIQMKQDCCKEAATAFSAKWRHIHLVAILTG
jgi:hypothetical protein